MSANTSETPAPAITAVSPPTYVSVESHIQTLTDLHNRLQGLRQAPALLLRPAGASTSSLSVSGMDPFLPQPSTLLGHDFEQLKEITETVQSQRAQEALTSAHELEKKDTTGLVLDGRREHIRRQRPMPAPESPLPYHPSLQSGRPFAGFSFPSTWSESDKFPSPLRLGELVEYVRNFNKSSRFRLHIWTPTRIQNRDLPLSNPVTVRFTIPDVVMVYMSLGSRSSASPLMVEYASAFGPREKKLPHSQTDYSVYQKLSQQFARILQKVPEVPFQLFMDLLSSYEDLFIRPCTACHRVLSVEGHIPPVARIWVEPQNQEMDKGVWDARHMGCLHG